METIKSFEVEFRNECGKVLTKLFNNPISMGETTLKRAVIRTEKRFIDYLEELNLIRNLKTGAGNDFGIQLERKGYEVFEKYNGWNDYLIKVVDRDLKINKSKELAIKFWWLPIGVSILSLVVAIVSLCHKS
ncbi:hypothetical protein ACM55G_00655 [Flavobacterium sp. LB3P122]|uniref:hypothetical protein n=1 Tax=Flavobacterium algoriphilum TaxID=3398738 RepID=UPI003A8AA676